MNAPVPVCPDCGGPRGRRSARCRPCASRAVARHVDGLAAAKVTRFPAPPPEAPGAETPDRLRRERDEAILSRAVLVRACEELAAERDLLKMQNQLLAVRIRRLEGP